MGILDRLFGKKQAAAPAVEDSPAAECPHALMAPHWDQTGDFGKHDLISFYICDACGARFGREEGDQVMAAGAAEKLRIDEALRKTTEEMVEGEKQGEG